MILISKFGVDRRGRRVILPNSLFSLSRNDDNEVTSFLYQERLLFTAIGAIVFGRYASKILLIPEAAGVSTVVISPTTE